MEDTLNKIREQSGSFRMEPSAKAWDRLRHKLDEKRGGGVVRMRIAAWAVAASAVGVVAIAALLLYQTNFRNDAATAGNRLPAQIEALDTADTDGVAQMALDYTEYLRRNHPEWLELLNEENTQF